MKHDVFDGGTLSYEPCRYGLSRIYFRGPKRNLDQPYIAFLGGTETFGKFIETPFPALIEAELRHPCVNFGCVNGGVDAFANDPTIMGACRDADLTVVQVMGANNLSNRFFSVHPRRNDRFLRASTVLQAIYSEIDFSDFTFTRHLLGALYEGSQERFDIVVAELRSAWVARMRGLLESVGKRVILLWFSREDLSDMPWDQRANPIGADPLFITKDMVDEIQGLVMDVVAVRPSSAAISAGTDGMHVPPMQKRAATDMLGLPAHAELAEILTPKVRLALNNLGRI